MSNVAGNQAVLRTSSTHILFDNLSIAAAYFFSVRAHNAVGFSQWSPEVSFHTVHPYASIPDAPSSIYLLDAFATELFVSWTNPQDGGSEILQFELQASRVEGTYWNVLTDYVHVSAISRLTADTSYFVRIRARNSVGWSPWSATIEAKTSNVGPPYEAVSPILAHRSKNCLALVWDPIKNNGSPILHYEVEIEDPWSSDPNPVIIYQTREEYAMTSDLIPGTRYTFRIRGCNVHGCGPWSNKASYETESYGFCGNEQDVSVILKTKVPLGILTLTPKCNSQDLMCQSENLRVRVGVSWNCSMAIALESSCTRLLCSKFCYFPRSAECHKCFHSKCTKNSHAKTGLPVQVLSWYQQKHL
jgi:hypothetical protein